MLTIFFDGVPEPRSEAPTPAQPAAVTAVPESARPTGLYKHEPYAQRECSACHDSAATNSLVLPREELCFQCHDFDLDKRYVHGPLVAGGCLLCHDPHSSSYPHLLLSGSDGFCLSCHSRQDLTKVAGHEEGRVDCTSCHEAHMSDKKYLLK